MTLYANYLRYAWNSLKKHIFSVICLALFTGALEYVWIIQDYSINSLESPGFLDCLIYLFSGSRPMIHSENLLFSIPYPWLCMQMLLLYAIYPVMKKNLDKQGEQILIRSKNKRLYYVSKLTAGTGIIFLCYGIVCSVLLICSLVFSHSVKMHPDILRRQLDISIKNFSNINLFLSIAILPVLTSVCLSWVQMVLSIRFPVVVSTIIIFAYDCLSVYIPSYLFIANYGMLWRVKQTITDASITGFSGIDQTTAFCVEVLLCITVFQIGEHMMKKYDVI